MSKKKNQRPLPVSTALSSQGRSRLLIPALIGLLALVGVGSFLLGRSSSNPAITLSSSSSPSPVDTHDGEAPAKVLVLPGSKSAAAIPSPSSTTGTSAITGAAKLEKMTVAQAVMVTAELDFGAKIPTIAEALKDIERVYAPEDGVGRTFSILDAYGEPTREGKLRISMHVSSEKTGLGSLVFRRTKQVLWQSRIGEPGQRITAPEKKMNIYLDDGTGKMMMLDGSKGGDSILDVAVSGRNTKVREVWPDGAEREVTFIYSACGCPVKVKVRRTGEKTIRTKELPVIFPDDSAAVQTISRLMGW